MRYGCRTARRKIAYPEGEDARVAHISVDLTVGSEESIWLEGVGVRVGILIKRLSVVMYEKM